MEMTCVANTLSLKLGKACDDLEKILLTLSPQKLACIKDNMLPQSLAEVRKLVVESKKVETFTDVEETGNSATAALLEPPLSELSLGMRKRSAIQFKPASQE